MTDRGNSPAGDLKQTVTSSLFAALIAVGSYLIIPLPGSPVPVALQSFFILLAGLVLGRSWGTASVAVFLLAGAIGLPVFAGAKGGLAHFVGPTGGYLVSYIPAVFVIGTLSGTGSLKKGRNQVLRNLAALGVGTLIIYAFGVPWLALSLDVGLPQALLLGLVPFLPGDILKIAAAVSVAPLLAGFLDRGERTAGSEAVEGE